MLTGTVSDIVWISYKPFDWIWNSIMSATSCIVFLISKLSLLIVNLLFSILDMSKASSIMFWRKIAELLMMFTYFRMWGSLMNYWSLLVIGIMVFNGVLSSCAIEAKNVDFICTYIFSISFILVMSLMMITNLLLKSIFWVFTCMYLLSDLDLKYLSLFVFNRVFKERI